MEISKAVEVKIAKLSLAPGELLWVEVPDATMKDTRDQICRDIINELQLAGVENPAVLVAPACIKPTVVAAQPEELHW